MTAPQEAFGQLRSLLHQDPHPARFLQLLELLREHDQPQDWLDYAQHHLQHWPDEDRLLPRTHLDILLDHPGPWLTLVRNLQAYGCNLQPPRLRRLLDIPQLQQLRILSLRNNTLLEPGYELLTTQAHFPHLHTLDLHKTAPNRGTILLADSPLLDNLHALDYSRCMLGPQDAEPLLRSPRLARLRWLDLSNTHCPRVTLEAITAPDTLPQLRTLLLDNNHLPDQDLALLGQGLPPLLEQLFLRNNGAQHRCASALFSSTHNALRELNLFSNSLGDQGIQALCAQRGLPALRSLDLGNNWFEPTALDDLAQAHILTQLDQLWLKRNKLTPDHLQILLDQPNLQDTLREHLRTQAI